MQHACMPSKNKGIADNSNSWRIEFNQHILVLGGFNNPELGVLFNTISRPTSSLSCAYNQNNYADKICFIHACMPHNFTGYSYY